MTNLINANITKECHERWPPPASSPSTPPPLEQRSDYPGMRSTLDRGVEGVLMKSRHPLVKLLSVRLSAQALQVMTPFSKTSHDLNFTSDSHATTNFLGRFARDRPDRPLRLPFSSTDGLLLGVRLSGVRVESESDDSGEESALVVELELEEGHGRGERERERGDLEGCEAAALPFVNFEKNISYENNSIVQKRESEHMHAMMRDKTSEMFLMSSKSN